MKFILIAQESAFLPYAVTVDSEDMQSAIAAVAESNKDLLQFSFIVDCDSGNTNRVYWSSEGQWALSDTAFNNRLGVCTTDGFFEEPQTAEMSE